MLIEFRNLLRIEQGHFVIHLVFYAGQIPFSEGVYDFNRPAWTFWYAFVVY